MPQAMALITTCRSQLQAKITVLAISAFVYLVTSRSEQAEVSANIGPSGGTKSYPLLLSLLKFVFYQQVSPAYNRRSSTDETGVYVRDTQKLSRKPA